MVSMSIKKRTDIIFQKSFISEYWMSINKRMYIGVDLGTWYNTTNKTSIAVGCEKNNKLYIEGIYKEYTKQDSKINCIYSDKDLEKLLPKNKKILNAINWNGHIDINQKNEYLVKFLKNQSNGNALIGIDAPFGIPSYLYAPPVDRNFTENIYNPLKEKGELSNPFIFDNSSRFVKKHTEQIALAPAGDKIGKITARMIHLLNYYKDELNIVKTPMPIVKNGLMTFEVFPAATLYLYIKYKKLSSKYLERYSSTENSSDKHTKLISYKNDNWNDENKKRMCELIKDDIEFGCGINIESDDDYDAVICALTTYLIDKHCYIKPDNAALFQDSFIYLPDIKCDK